MNDKLALNLIAEIMGWDEDVDGTATREYAWLRLMSAIKYDGYADFRAGVRFIESLATWLKQFRAEDRATAYKFIKRRLVYISPAELQCLIEAFVPEVVVPGIRRAVASELGVKPYEVWKTAAGHEAFRGHLRRTLFVGMSDGSRIDVLRRANSNRLSNEQVVPMLNIDNAKWHDLKSKLSKERGEGATFDRVYLVDDLTASGTTFIRRDPDTMEWTGKLKKFNDLILSAKRDLGNRFPIADNYALHIHHYIASHQARNVLAERLAEADSAWTEKSYKAVTVTEGLLLPPTIKLSAPDDAAMLELCDRYYDHDLFLRREPHCRQAGQSHMKWGYADCALPIVLDHNAPNNAISLLWAETAGKNGAHPMRPLFRRRERFI